MIFLKTPEDCERRLIQMGNVAVQIEPNQTCEVPTRNFADYLIEQFGFEEVADPKAFPTDFPNAKPFIAADLGFDSVKNMTAEEIDQVPGVGKKVLKDVLAYLGK
jgi:hypothetical protein